MNEIIPPADIMVIVLLLMINFVMELFQTAFDNVSISFLKKKFTDEEINENNKIKKIFELLEQPLRYLYTNKLVRVMCWMVIGYISVKMLLERALFEQNNSPILFVAVTALVILVALSIAVYLPRKLALQHSMQIAIGVSRFQNVICVLIAPIRKFMLLITNLILRIFKQEIHVENKVFYEEDIMSMLEVGQESGAIKEEGKKMIDSIFAFDDELAYEIMTPRTDVFMVDIDDSPDEYMDELMELRYSRIPVCEGEPDNIIGILNIKDYLINARRDGFDNIDIKAILREPYFVPDTKKIDALFMEFQKTKNQIAILIDEYGGFSGIVTMEDIIEEIVGEIDDEYDLEDHVIKKIGEDEYILDGNVDLDDLNEELGTNFVSETSETISGFLIDLIGEIPEEGTKRVIDFENYQFLIINVEDRRITKIKLTILNDAKTQDEEV